MTHALILASLAFLAAWCLIVIIGIAAQDWTFCHRIAVVTDMFWALVFLQQYDITLSSWAGLHSADSRVAYVLFAVLEKIQPGHCSQARLADIDRATAAIAYLNGK